MQLAAVPLPTEPGMNEATRNPAQLTPESLRRVAAAVLLLRQHARLSIAEAIRLLRAEEARLGDDGDVRDDMLCTLGYLITFGFEPIVQAFGFNETSTFLHSLFPDTFDQGDGNKSIGLGLRYSDEIAKQLYDMT